MAPSSNATPFDDAEEIEDESSADADSTCPECGTESVATYLDRYSSYEYCTNCDWSDEDAAGDGQRELIERRDRGRSDL